MIIQRLIQDYCNHENISLSEFAKRLGYHYKIVWNWYNGHHFPNHFSATCILDLFKKNIPKEILREYEESFWYLWTFEKQIVDSRVKNKLVRNKMTERLANTERPQNA